MVQTRALEEVEPRRIYDDQELTLEKRNSRGNLSKRSKKRIEKKRKRAIQPTLHETVDASEIGTSNKKVRFDSNSPLTHEPRVPEEQGGNESIREEEQTNNTNTTNQNLTIPLTTAATSNPHQTHDQFEDDNPTLDIDPFEDKEPYEMTNEINDALNVEPSSAEVGGACVVSISGHSWHAGQLKLGIIWSSEEKTWESFRDMKEDHPQKTAQYMVDQNVTRSKRVDRNLQWPKKALRDISRTVRRIARIYDVFLEEHDDIFHVRRLQNNKKKKKKKQFTPGPQFKHGVQVPQSVEQAIKLDEANGNTAWQDAIEKEMSQLVRLECFDFKPADHNPGDAFLEDKTPADLRR